MPTRSDDDCRLAYIVIATMNETDDAERAAQEAHSAVARNVRSADAREHVRVEARWTERRRIPAVGARPAATMEQQRTVSLVVGIGARVETTRAAIELVARRVSDAAQDEMKRERRQSCLQAASGDEQAQDAVDNMREGGDTK